MSNMEKLLRTGLYCLVVAHTPAATAVIFMTPAVFDVTIRPLFGGIAFIAISLWLYLLVVGAVNAAINKPKDSCPQ